MINKISDLEIGKEYDILLVKDKRLIRKAIVKAIINEKDDLISERTEIYVALYQRGKLKSTNLFYANEFGIGENTNEAYDNYGRFDFEDNDNFETSFEKVKER
ncbi:MAG: hypothetical protein Q7V19_13500 [Bacteroidales bacterium]|nr:hypothetical protein [Bacteroidales bacterium]